MVCPAVERGRQHVSKVCIIIFVKIAETLNNTFLCAGLKRKRDDHGMEVVVAIIEGMEERAWEREERVRKKEMEAEERRMRMELEAEERMRERDQRQEERMMHLFSTFLQQMSGVNPHAPFTLQPHYQPNPTSPLFPNYCTHPQDGPSSQQ